MLVDLDELDLDLGAFGDRRLGLQVDELALREDRRVVGVDALLRHEEEPLLGRLLDLARAACRPRPSRSDAVLGLTSTRNACAREPAASARRRRSTSSAAEASERTMPSPAQVGHFFVRISRGPSVTFWRVISTRPSGEISTT